MVRSRPRHRAQPGAPPAMQQWHRALPPTDTRPLLVQAAAGLAGWWLDVPVHHASRAWRALCPPRSA